LQNKVAYEGGGAVNALLLLPLNLRSRLRGPFAVWGFSGGKQLYCGAIAASLGASGKIFAGNGADLLVLVQVVMLVVLLMAMMSPPLAMVMVYSAFEKKKPLRG
jgi:hypothetical protein